MPSLEELRELQGAVIPRNERMTYEEYRQENLYKLGANPGFGMMGRQFAGTSSTTFNVPGGEPEGKGPSQYSLSRPSQPPPWIDDVDMRNNPYSPMEPVWPFGPPYITRPREWNFPVGYNLNYIPQRLDLYGMLRGMRQSWGVLSTVIETRKDQLLRLPWTIQVKDKPRTSSKAVNEMRQFFRKPDGKLRFGQWSRKLLDDLFVLDAPYIYMDRGIGGKLRYAEVLDGGTIFPLIDDVGRRPDTEYEVGSDGIVYLRRQPAFQQIIYGLPMINLSEDELIYAMMRPRPELPMFGYSPVEQILSEVTEAIRKTFYQLEFWRSGSMPEMIITVPDNWTPRQIATFQAHFDALLSGQLSLKSKVRFVPGGMKPFDIKNASGESLWSERDEMLIRLACYAFSVSPTPFVRQTNRATAQNAQQSAQEEGLYPLMSWWKDDIIDRIIQEVFGYDDVEFVFLPRPEVDLLKQAQIHQIQINGGIRTRNEIRGELGQEPINDGDIMTVSMGGSVTPLDLIIDGGALAPGTPAPAKPSGVPTPTHSVEGTPQRGPARPNNASTLPPTPVHKATRAELDAAAEQAKGHLNDYSQSQLKTGNYPKGHIWIQGLNISIENKKGSLRGEKDQSGTKWQVRMPTAYGYIRGTIGADGDAVDVYLGKDPESTTVWVIDQNKVSKKKGKIKGFDEHKVMLGYDRLKDAVKDYLASHFDNHGHERIDKITELSMKEFKDWLKSGDTKKPIAGQAGKVVLKQKDLEKFDTISQSTGLLSYSQGLPFPQRKRKKAKKSNLRLVA